MSALKMVIVIVAMITAVAAGPALSQTPPAGQQKPPAGQPTPPTGQQTPTPAPPAAQQPPVQPPSPQPPAPFPEGAKIAWVDIQTVASNSAEGKAASTKIQDLNKKKTAELGEKQKSVQALQTKLQQGGSVLSEQARTQLEKDIDKQNRELQFAQSDAQAEIQQLTQELQNEFQQKLQPILDQIAKEKGLHFILSVRDSGAAWVHPGLDMSAEVVKRFDAASKTPVKK